MHVYSTKSRETTVRKTSKCNKHDSIDLTAPVLGVSYRQLGSDTKLCGAPIKRTETPHIPAPETLEWRSLDIQ